MVLCGLLGGVLDFAVTHPLPLVPGFRGDEFEFLFHLAKCRQTATVDPLLQRG